MLGNLLHVLILGIIFSLGVCTVTAGNLALGQPTSLTDGNVTANLAVDGNPQKCLLTSLSTDPWWRVDLGMSYIVEEVKIISGAEALTNFEIRIGDSLGNQGNSNQLCGGLHTMTSSQEKSFHCTPGIRGRYVNIRTAGDNQKLAICEVSVNPNPTVNLALQKSASQSSQCCNGRPRRAVDGNLDGDFNSLSCSQTSRSTDPWWRVDLGSSHALSEVFISSRIAWKERLDIEIRVGEKSDGKLNPRCGGVYDMTGLRKASFYCKPRKTGRYLSIGNIGNHKFVALCEVEIYSESRAYFQEKMKIIDVYEDSPASLNCPDPFGYPEPSIAWVKNDVVLQNSSSYVTFNLTTVKRSENGSVIDCVASNKHGSDYCRLILNVKSRFKMCTEFKDILNNARTVQGNVSRATLNDGDISAVQWYRFVDHVTREPVKLPDSCKDPWTCGTQAPGWLRGGHPSVEDNVSLRTVCFSWNNSCCFAEVQAQVRHCYGYYVYKLQPTTFEVKARYCTEKATIKNRDAIFKQVTSKNGKQYALLDHVITKEDHVEEAWKCMTYCLLETICASFNYLHVSSVCEINNSTRSRIPDSISERAGNEYHEKVEELSILAIYDVTTDATSRGHSSAINPIIKDPWWLNLEASSTFNHRSESTASSRRRVSFNCYPQNETCELNNSTGSSNPDDLEERPGIDY